MKDNLPSRCHLLCRLLFSSLVFLLPCTSLVLAASKADEARRSIAGFYNLYLKLHPFGVPNAQTQGKLAPYLSSSLRQQLKNALAAEQRYAKQNRNEVPPLVESDLFTSLFEGASGFKIASCEIQEKQRSCLAQFSRNDAAKKVMSWQDRVYVISESHGWMIDEVEYLGDWQFMHKGRLKTLLQDVIAESDKK